MTDLLECGGERPLAHRRVGPHPVEQLVLGDDAIPVPEQIEEQPQGRGVDLDGATLPAELSQGLVRLEIPESEDDRPVVVEFRCDPSAMVFPMVPAGGSNDDIVLGPEDL